MIGQYLSNNNETATVTFHQKICQLNSLLVDPSILDSYLELDLDSILAPCIVSVGTPIRPAREQREGCLPQFLTPLFLFSQ
jgi:hypothetical protein